MYTTERITEEEVKAIKDYIFKNYPEKDGKEYMGYDYFIRIGDKRVCFYEDWDEFNYHDESWTCRTLVMIEKLSSGSGQLSAEEIEAALTSAPGCEHFRWYKTERTVITLPGVDGTLSVISGRGDDRAYINGD